jgi:hypothetical protein
MTDHPGAIPLDAEAPLTDESVEVARVWITDGGGATVFIMPDVLEDAEVFGYLMADTIRHAARAYAEARGADEDEMLQAIVDGVAAELREQFANIERVQGKLN